MLGGDETIRALREALRLSPENVPLRQHLADTLLKSGRADEAEAEYRLALALAPGDSQLKLGLASAFYQQSKNTEALVVVEDLLKSAEVPARAFLLHARLLLRADDRGRAAHQYRRALELDLTIADPELAEQLGVRSASAVRDLASDAPVVDGRVRAAWDDVVDMGTQAVERPMVTFADVGGVEDVKDEIRMKIIHPLAHLELYRAYGKPIGGGILMYGPPGCGKTHLARATAGEIKAGFIAVGLDDVLDMWIGNSEKNLHELFEEARRNRPCVLFFDEVDALGASRSDMRQSHGRHLINQFLAEMDGVKSSNEGVLVLAATNAPWHLDPAFRRPGRFDRILFVPPPDVPARASILRILCRGKPLADVDFEQLAKKTDGFSGADLRAVVDVAIERKLRDALKDGVPKPLTTKDFVGAATGLKPTTKEWFATARNYALYANQGGAYDDVLKYLRM
ncbi:MAG: AAA family ATPase [Chloroflexi bacterium]|nr:AAA family ATPase [Chloroflexota bacterium]